MNKYGLPKGIRFVSGAFRWEARYKGRRITGTSKCLEEAVQQREQIQDQLKGILPTTEPKEIYNRARLSTQLNCPTLHEAIQKLYKTDWEDSKSIRTIETYTQQIEDFFGKDIKLYEITDKKIEDIVNYWLSQNNKKSTINTKLCYISNIMNSAKKQNKIKSKPTITKFKVKNARQARISKEDEQKIMEYFDINKIYKIIYFSGIIFQADCKTFLQPA